MILHSYQHISIFPHCCCVINHPKAKWLKIITIYFLWFYWAEQNWIGWAVAFAWSSLAGGGVYDSLTLRPQPRWQGWDDWVLSPHGLSSSGSLGQAYSLSGFSTRSKRGKMPMCKCFSSLCSFHAILMSHWPNPNSTFQFFFSGEPDRSRKQRATL
jgi:hypothetical protein